MCEKYDQKEEVGVFLQPRYAIGEYMKFEFAIFLFAVSSFVYGENVCPEEANSSWDKMKESDFSRQAAIKQLQNLNEIFNGEIEVAEEFIYQSNLVFEGAFYRMEIDRSKGDPKNLKIAKDRFCKFMAEQAYLVH